MAVHSFWGQNSFSSLQRRWLALAMLSSVLLAGGYTVLQSVWEPVYAWRWLLLASGAVVYLLTVFWNGLADNHKLDEEGVLPHLGVGNVISLARGLLLAGLAGFTFSPWPQGWLAWLPGLLYLTATLADFFDGYAARRTGQVTRLGEILDISLDGLGVLAAAWLAVQYGQAPAWYMLVALARYLFLAGLWLRRRKGLPVYPLPPSPVRRGLAGVQMGFAAGLLLPVFSPPGTHWAAALFAAPFLAGFLKDWLHIGGVLKPQKAGPEAGQRLLSGLLPLGLRLAAAGALPFVLLDGSLPPLQLGQAVVLIALSAGFAGRISASLGLFLLGLSQAPAGFTPFQVILLVIYVGLLYLGTGRFSLWRPEERWIFPQPGETA